LRSVRRYEPFSALQSHLAMSFSVCGRKKLPFAGYSVVKELVEAPSCRLSPPAVLRVRLRPCGRVGTSFTQMGSASNLSSAGTFYPTPPACPMQAEGSRSLSFRRVLPLTTAVRRTRERGWASEPQPSANAGGICNLNEVENTGLEPVTSWLQTRRSPS
jgi:hypothetical protein